MPTFSIGQLAKRAGVAIDTVRYYERNQLLAPAAWNPATAGMERRSSSDCGSSVVRRRWVSRSRISGNCCP